jgi:hypothetical protein
MARTMSDYSSARRAVTSCIMQMEPLIKEAYRRPVPDMSVPELNFMTTPWKVEFHPRHGQDTRIALAKIKPHFGAMLIPVYGAPPPNAGADWLDEIELRQFVLHHNFNDPVRDILFPSNQLQSLLYGPRRIVLRQESMMAAVRIIELFQDDPDEIADAKARILANMRLFSTRLNLSSGRILCIYLRAIQEMRR